MLGSEIHRTGWRVVLNRPPFGRREEGWLGCSDGRRNLRRERRGQDPHRTGGRWIGLAQRAATSVFLRLLSTRAAALRLCLGSAGGSAFRG